MATSTRSKPKRRVSEVDRFAAFCRVLGVRLEPFQRRIVAEVFAGRRELVVLIPRGNGKTTLFALVALWHLLTHHAPRVYLAAASKDQADIAFEVARDMVRRHPALRSRLAAKFRRLDRKDGAGFMKVISSDAGRQHGLQPTLVLVDELHAHKNPDLYVAVKTAMGKPALGKTKPAGQLVTISTAGHDQDELLGQLRERAFAEGDVEQADKRLRVARIEQSSFALLEWACRDADDLTDPKVVKLANPASFVTEQFLLEQIHSPGLHPVEFATYHANVWRDGIDSWLGPAVWDSCADARFGIPPDARVYLGVDIGMKYDTTAVAVWFRAADGKLTLRVRVFEPRGDGTEFDLGIVEDHIRELASRYRVMQVGYDKFGFARSAQILRNEGLDMIEIPWSNERIGPATGRLYEAIMTKRVRHDGDRVLAAHVASAATSPTEYGVRITKRKATSRMDGLAAALLGFILADEPAPVPGASW